MLFPQPLAACAALLLTVVSLWIHPKLIKLWLAVLAMTVMLGYVCQVMHGPAIVWILLVGIAAWACERETMQPALRAGLVPIVVILTVLLGMHALPGFSNPLVVKDLIITPNALPYTLYCNFDKGIAGILLLGLASAPLLRSSHEWGVALRRTAPVMILTILAAMVLSLAFGYVEFQPKWTGFFWTWAAINLLLTCASEEAFFRGFIQRKVAAFLAQRLGRTADVIAIGASAVLFGVAHFAGGWQYVVLSTIAGAGYAIAYQRTGRIEMSILTHFAVNTTHFLLFTYPQSA